jgi:hypothetical protein
MKEFPEFLISNRGNYIHIYIHTYISEIYERSTIRGPPYVFCHPSYGGKISRKRRQIARDDAKAVANGAAAASCLSARGAITITSTYGSTTSATTASGAPHITTQGKRFFGDGKSDVATTTTAASITASAGDSRSTITTTIFTACGTRVIS